jgi:hypothetical protein
MIGVAAAMAEPASSYIPACGDGPAGPLSTSGADAGKDTGAALAAGSGGAPGWLAGVITGSGSHVAVSMY